MLETLQWTFDHYRLTLCGVLDYTTATSLWQQRRQLFLGERLIIDLQALTRIDSAGLALLMQLTELASQQKIACQIAGMSRKLHSLMAIYNLLPIVTPYFEPNDLLLE